MYVRGLGCARLGLGSIPESGFHGRETEIGVETRNHRAGERGWMEIIPRNPRMPWVLDSTAGGRRKWSALWRSGSLEGDSIALAAERLSDSKQASFREYGLRRGA